MVTENGHKIERHTRQQEQKTKGQHQTSMTSSHLHASVNSHTYCSMQFSLYFPPVFSFVLLHTPVKMTDTNIYISLPDLHCSVLLCSLRPPDSARLYLLSLLGERHTYTNTPKNLQHWTKKSGKWSNSNEEEGGEMRPGNMRSPLIINNLNKHCQTLTAKNSKKQKRAEATGSVFHLDQFSLTHVRMQIMHPKHSFFMSVSVSLSALLNNSGQSQHLLKNRMYVTVILPYFLHLLMIQNSIRKSSLIHFKLVVASAI